MTEPCPQTFALAALIDGELAPPERSRLLAHAAECPLCGPALSELQALRCEFRALPQERLGFDLGDVIEHRLRSARGRRRSGVRRRPAAWWQWLMPLGSATAALVLGLQLGDRLLGLADEGAARAPQLVTMSVFDPVPPGNLCLPATPCPSGNRAR